MSTDVKLNGEDQLQRGAAAQMPTTECWPCYICGRTRAQMGGSVHAGVLVCALCERLVTPDALPDP